MGLLGEQTGSAANAGSNGDAGSSGSGNNGGVSSSVSSGDNSGSSQGNAGGGSSGASAGSGASKTWRDDLPEELKAHGSLQNFTDVASLAKSYVHAQQAIGKKGVIPPNEKSSDEEWSQFYKSIGQPELDKFELKTPEGKQVNPEVISQFKELSHKSGLLPKQAQSVMEWYIKHEENMMGQQLVAKETKVKEGLTNLKKEWGDGYEKQIAMAELPLKEFADDETVKHFTESGLTKDATFIKFMNKVSSLMGEDKLRGQGGGKFGKTPDELKSDIDQIISQPGYFDRTHPTHASLVRQMEVAQRALHGD